MIHHVADALGVLGEIALAEGRHGDAVEHLAESVRLWRTRGWPSFLALALATLGDAYQDVEAASRCWTEARDLFAGLGSTGRVAALTAKLDAISPCN
jgi:hypothetical protein